MKQSGKSNRPDKRELTPEKRIRSGMKEILNTACGATAPPPGGGGREGAVYDYGARFYDPQLGRWHVPDPAIEDNHYEWTPYAYVYNNPILLLDPFGLDSIAAAEVKQSTEKTVQYIKDNYGETSAQCNRGVAYSHKETTGSNELEGKSANELVDYMETSTNFEKVESDKVQEQANDGEIIYGGKKESDGSGHVNQAVPGEEVSSTNWEGKAPVGMDTGAKKRWAKKGMNYSWTSPKGVTFYKYTGPNYKTYDGGTLPTVTVTARGLDKLQPIKATHVEPRK